MPSGSLLPVHVGPLGLGWGPQGPNSGRGRAVGHQRHQGALLPRAASALHVPPGPAATTSDRRLSSCPRCRTYPREGPRARGKGNPDAVKTTWPDPGAPSGGDGGERTKGGRREEAGEPSWSPSREVMQGGVWRGSREKKTALLTSPSHSPQIFWWTARLVTNHESATQTDASNRPQTPELTGTPHI